MNSRTKPNPLVIVLMFAFALLGLLTLFLVNGVSAQDSCVTYGNVTAIRLDLYGDPNSPYVAEIRGEIPAWEEPAAYVVIPASEGDPPRFWLNPFQFLYAFARVDAGGWAYTLIPDEDPYVNQPERPDYANWYQFQNPAAVDAFSAIVFTSGYQEWWKDAGDAAPPSNDELGQWRVYEDGLSSPAWSVVIRGSGSDPTMSYPLSFSRETLDGAPNPADNLYHPTCWEGMELSQLDEFKRLVLLQREAWSASH